MSLISFPPGVPGHTSPKEAWAAELLPFLAVSEDSSGAAQKNWARSGFLPCSCTEGLSFPMAARSFRSLRRSRGSSLGFGRSSGELARASIQVHAGGENGESSDHSFSMLIWKLASVLAPWLSWLKRLSNQTGDPRFQNPSRDCTVVFLPSKRIRRDQKP